MYYTAIKAFDHDRRRYSAGQRPLTFSRSMADQLKRAGLIVEYVPPALPPAAGSVAFCLASGPSLTPEDCEAVREYRERTGAIVIAVNLTFRRAPWADFLYGMDRDFWDKYGEEVKGFKGRKVAPHIIKGTEYQDIVAGNSGAGAIMLAAGLGAKRIVLVGFDCQHTGGFAHWHADYPKGMGNAGSVKKWPGQFAAVARNLPADVEVVNASRETALLAWPRLPLEEALAT